MVISIMEYINWLCAMFVVSSMIYFVTFWEEFCKHPDETEENFKKLNFKGHIKCIFEIFIGIIIFVAIALLIGNLKDFFF